MNSEGSCYQSLQNIPVKKEVNPSGSSTQAVHNINMMDTAEKSKLPEESRYGPIGFSHFLKFSSQKTLWFASTWSKTASQQIGHTDNTYILWNSPTICSQLSHLHSVPSFYPCFLFLPVTWGGEARFSACLLVSAVKEGRIVGGRSPVCVCVSGLRFAKKAP